MPQLYVTPEKYRTMGFGVDLGTSDEDKVEDFELAAILDRASRMADSFCGVSQVPVPNDFTGGEIIEEQHSWAIPEDAFSIGQRRIYPYHWPIKEVTGFRIYVTNTQYVEIAPSEIFVNNTERYIEVISLAFTGVGLFGAIIPSLGLMKPVARISYTYGTSFQAGDERLYPTDALTYRAANQHWETDPAPVISVGGAVVTTGYVVDSGEGEVEFDAPQAPDAKVTALYSYRLPSPIRDAVGILATHLLAEKALESKGMGDVGSIKVGEVTITRFSPRLSAQNMSTIEPGAALLLAGYTNLTIRG